jgi:hypothetical protein
MLEVLYCCECQDNLNKYGEYASEVFIAICNYYLVHKQPISIRTSIHCPNHGILEVVRFLELKHYVTSIEREKDSVLVKPLGVSCFEEDDNHLVCHVCFEREKHA